jgi:hypothetical protein
MESGLAEDSTVGSIEEGLAEFGIVVLLGTDESLVGRVDSMPASDLEVENKLHVHVLRSDGGVLTLSVLLKVQGGFSSAQVSTEMVFFDQAALGDQALLVELDFGLDSG